MITITPRGSRVLLHGIGDLDGELLLHLGPAAVALDEAGDLREAGDPAVVAGDVGDVRLPAEGDEVVLAHALQRDVAHHDHLVVARLEGDGEVLGGVVVEARRRSRRTCGRPAPACRRGRHGRGPRRWPPGSPAPPARCAAGPSACRWLVARGARGQVPLGLGARTPTRFHHRRLAGAGSDDGMAGGRGDRLRLGHRGADELGLDRDRDLGGLRLRAPRCRCPCRADRRSRRGRSPRGSPSRRGPWRARRACCGGWTGSPGPGRGRCRSGARTSLSTTPATSGE